MKPTIKYALKNWRGFPTSPAARSVDVNIFSSFTIKTFRGLISEKYTYGELLVSCYVAIEMTEHETGDNLPQLEEYERISVVSAIIESLAPIHIQLDSNHPRYNPHLANWLNLGILRHQIHSFKGKICNIRMLDRLCLSENCEEMENTLQHTQ